MDKAIEDNSLRLSVLLKYERLSPLLSGRVLTLSYKFWVIILTSQYCLDCVTLLALSIFYFEFLLSTQAKRKNMVQSSPGVEAKKLYVFVCLDESAECRVCGPFYIF